MGEIATWAMIHAKIPSFPAPASGRENECLTKSEILNVGGGYIITDGSYGDSECVMLDDIRNHGIWVEPSSFTGNGLGQKMFNAQLIRVRGAWRCDVLYLNKGGSIRIEPPSGYGNQSIQVIAELHEDSDYNLSAYLKFDDDSSSGTIGAVQIYRL